MVNIPIAVAPSICVRSICTANGAYINQSLNNVNFIANSNLLRVNIWQH